MAISEIPQFVPYQHLDHKITIAESIVFKAHYISRLMGADSTSNFKNIVDTWKNHMTYFKKAMPKADYSQAEKMLGFMNNYMAMKVNPKSEESRKFWGRFTTAFGLENGSFLGHEGNTSNKLDDKQMSYWTKVYNGLEKYKNGIWLSPQGKITQGGKVVTKPIDYSKVPPSDYWKGSWGPDPVKDASGNALYNSHHFAAQIFNQDSSEFLPVSHNSVLSASEDIAINVPKEDLHNNYPIKFLTLFESSRLGNKLTAQDHLFCRGIEKMFADWVSGKKVTGVSHLFVKHTSNFWTKWKEWNADITGEETGTGHQPDLEENENVEVKPEEAESKSSVKSKKVWHMVSKWLGKGKNIKNQNTYNGLDKVAGGYMKKHMNC